MKDFAGLILTGLICAGPVMAQDAPNSAIEWLSESIQNPPNFSIPPDDSAATGPLISQIALDPSTDFGIPDAVGLLPPTVTGFPAAFWGVTPSGTAAEMIARQDIGTLPAAKALFQQILLAQTDPPTDASSKPVVLLARIDRLIETGALDAAEALMVISGPSTPALFKRQFDVALLVNRTQAACDALKANPNLSNDLATRVFCLARNGDWNAAATTLSLGATIGMLDRPREEMLIRFLDPDLFEGTKDPDPPEDMTATDFFLREAVLLPRPSGLLPLAYVYGDTNARAPLRMQIEASERLVAAGTLPSNFLFSAYRSGKAASSGGIWGRAEAVQSLDKALSERDEAAIAATLPVAAEALAKVGLSVAFAQEYAPTLANQPFEGELEQVADLIASLLLLADLDARSWALGSEDTNILFASALVAGKIDTEHSTSSMTAAIAEAFGDEAPDSSATERLLMDIDGGSYGPAVLGALRLLASGTETDPQSVEAALFALRRAGLEKSARQLAVQILLLPNG